MTNGASATAKKHLDAIQVLNLASDGLSKFAKIHNGTNDDTDLRDALYMLNRANPELLAWLRAALAEKG